MLAQTGPKKHPLLPNVPTFVDLNLKDAVVEVWYGVMAPAGLPANVREKLIKELALVLKDPEVLDRLGKAGLGSGFDRGRRIPEICRRRTGRLDGRRQGVEDRDHRLR